MSTLLQITEILQQRVLSQLLQFGGMRGRIAEFLESRGFTLEQTGEEIEIRIGRRSLAGGLNEIFVGTDEIDSIKSMGRIVTISCGKEAIIIKVLKSDQSE